jgi:predicted metal-dependent enzyme (double-stranded beta helix superfamily)
MAPGTATAPSAAAADLVAGIDAIIRRAAGDTKATVDSVRSLVADFVSNERATIPAACRRALPDRYARRLLHHSDAFGYSVVVMTWGPGQGTEIHDHGGMWCVEGVWQGCIEVVQYEQLESRGVLARFEARGCVQACAGSAGSLIPPHEYHTIANPSATDTAVTLHVYSGEMIHCNAFAPAGSGDAVPRPAAPDGGGWYRRRPVALSFD